MWYCIYCSIDDGTCDLNDGSTDIRCVDDNGICIVSGKIQVAQCVFAELLGD